MPLSSSPSFARSTPPYTPKKIAGKELHLVTDAFAPIQQWADDANQAEILVRDISQADHMELKQKTESGEYYGSEAFFYTSMLQCMRLGVQARYNMNVFKAGKVPKTKYQECADKVRRDLIMALNAFVAGCDSVVSDDILAQQRKNEIHRWASPLHALVTDQINRYNALFRNY